MPMHTPSRLQEPRSKKTSEDLAPPIRTFPTEVRRAPRNWATLLLGLSGLAALGLGAAVVWGPARSPQAADLATRLGSAGVQSGHLFAAGAALGGLALVSLFLSTVARTLLRPGAVEEALSEVGADLAEFRNKLYEFENDHVFFRTTLEQALKEVREHRQKDRSAEAVDALFRLAGSLDTLHAHLDQRLQESSSVIQSTLTELGSLVEASRDYLQESLEESDQRLVALGQSLHELARPVAGPSEEAPPVSAAEECLQEEEPPEDDEGALGLGLLDQLDDLGSDETWCDEEVREEMATLELEQDAQPDAVQRIEFEEPLPPLPAVQEEGESSHIERMQDVVRDSTSAQIIESWSGDEPPTAENPPHEA